MERMTITDTTVIADLDKLAAATDRDRDELVLEILRNFFHPRYKNELIRDFRWRMDVLGGADLEPRAGVEGHVL
jgi:hypothetical protein